jgi:phage-related protein
MLEVKNNKDITLKIGDKLLIVNNQLSNKTLGLLSIGDIITITSFSENKKILYYFNSLGLSVNSNVYVRI